MTPSHLLPLAFAAVVTVVVNGVFVPTAPPAAIHAGHVAGPMDLVARFADRVETGADGTVVAVRGERSCGARPLAGSDPPLVEIAPLARCLGGDVRWDGAAKTLTVAFGGETVVRTLPPYDPHAPRAAPTTVFTPEPAPPTPRVIATGSPRPRRTPVPAVPSWPLPTTATTPRP